MSLEESDDLGILNTRPVDPVLEASALAKFDMHLYTSSLTEINVKWLTKCYGIPVDLRPRVVPEGMTMNALPNDAIGLYADHFQQGGLRVPFSSFFLKVVEHFCVHISQLVLLGINRVTFFELYCRALDIIPTVHLFRVFYKLCKQGNWFLFQNRVGKNRKPCLKDAPTSLKKWKDKFFLVDRRAAPIAMACRHHDSSVAEPFPKPTEYNASDVTKLREVVISLRKPPPSLLYVAGLSNVWKHASRVFSLKDSKGKVVTMAKFLRFPNFKGCKIVGGDLLPPGSARVTHLSSLTERLEDLPPKTGDMVTAEIPCRKVLDDKEKKKRKSEKKAATNAPAANIQAERVARNKDAGKEGAPDEEYVSPNVSAGRMGVLRNQTDEHITPPPVFNAGGFVRGREGVQENLYVAFIREGHCDNEGPLLETVERPKRTKVVSKAETSEYYDMMSNLFTPADNEFFNEGVRNESAVKRSWKMLCQSAQQQDNALLCFEALMEEHTDLVYAHESSKDVKAHYKECKKELAQIQSAYDEKSSSHEQLSKNYEGALTREKSLQDRVKELEDEKKESEHLNSDQADRIKQLEEALKQFEADAHQLRLEREKFNVEAGNGEMVFSLAVGKGFIDGISIGLKDPDIQVILKATPNVDPASTDIFMDTYEQLFDQRYPYVDKVARMYLLDPSGLQNFMPDETGPTPGGGPRDTPTAS
ncbi:hypothetical protein Tco_1015879 [Tanacetum coccineum]|uniref:Transposase (putative) gypsy type domain-containing protein n=1 Tax=Tanacetum coccineum TaxID=301880 RepID=A0ABQ5FN49_9ASTR